MNTDGSVRVPIAPLPAFVDAIHAEAQVAIRASLAIFTVFLCSLQTHFAAFMHECRQVCQRVSTAAPRLAVALPSMTV
jgi:hypothetical protein